MNAPTPPEHASDYATLEVAKERDRQFFNSCITLDKPQVISCVARWALGFTHLWPFSKSKFNLYEVIWSLTASTLFHRLVMSIELGTAQDGTGKVDLARIFKSTTAVLELVDFWTVFFAYSFVRGPNLAKSKKRNCF